MKSYISIFLLMSFLFLTGCFWGNSESSEQGLVEYKEEKFSLQLPASWQMVPESRLPEPNSGKLALAYESPTQRDGYINNIIVLEIPALENESSQSLMANMKIGLSSSLASYKLLSESPLTFADGDTGSVLTYEGKYSRSTPKAVYIQSAKVCDDTQYFLTLSLTQQLESYDRYAQILETFGCE
jgi:hypothetical protein